MNNAAKNIIKPIATLDRKNIPTLINIYEYIMWNFPWNWIEILLPLLWDSTVTIILVKFGTNLKIFIYVQKLQDVLVLVIIKKFISLV